MRRPHSCTIVRAAALGGALLSAACAELPTTPSARPVPTASNLAPSAIKPVHNGYMLSSGRIKDTDK